MRSFLSHIGIGLQTEVFQTGWRTLNPKSIFQIRKKITRETTSELVNVQRSPGKPDDLPTKRQIDDCLALPSYTEFTTTLEGLHADVHAWVGGTMRDLLTSPADPLFWMHHANVDRIYTLWQKTHPDNPSTIPRLSGSDLNIDPWEGTEPDYRHWDWIAYVAN
jgi:hypothetical protein